MWDFYSCVPVCRGWMASRRCAERTFRKRCGRCWLRFSRRSSAWKSHATTYFAWELWCGRDATIVAQTESRSLTSFGMTNRKRSLAHNQYFANVIAGQKELDGSEIAEEIFDVPVIKDTLQLETVIDGGVHRSSRPATRFPAQHDA